MIHAVVGAREQDKLTGNSVFRWCLNVDSNSNSLMWRGREWQALNVEMQKADLNHTQLALVMFSQYSATFVRDKANDSEAYAIRAWFK